MFVTIYFLFAERMDYLKELFFMFPSRLSNVDNKSKGPDDYIDIPLTVCVSTYVNVLAYYLVL